MELFQKRPLLFIDTEKNLKYGLFKKLSDFNGMTDIW